MSNVSDLKHIVFCTKYREMTITNEYREDLYRMIWSLLKSKNCYLLRISGFPNHVHMLIDLHPSISVADLLRDIKSKSSSWLSQDKDRFPRFRGWAQEYFCSSVSFADRNNVIEYIKNQQQHHGIQDFLDEMNYLCKIHGQTLHPSAFTK